MVAKKRTERPMMCFTCGEVTTLILDETKYGQYDVFADEHDHNPDWKRWTHNRKAFPRYPERQQ